MVTPDLPHSDLNRPDVSHVGKRVVVRGTGSIGLRHAQVLRALGADVVLWSVRERRPGVVPGVDQVSGAGARAALDQCDLVVVATDTDRHVEDAIVALDARAKRVLVEKPVAPTADQAQALADHPRHRDVWVAAPLRAHRAFSVVAGHVTAMEAPLHASAWAQSWLPDWRPDRDYRSSYSARRDQGGVLRDLIHEIDYLHALMGPGNLSGAVLDFAGPLPIQSEQTADLLWSTPRGTVTLRLDYVSRTARRGLVVSSSSDLVEWDVLQGVVRHESADAGTRHTFHEPGDLDRNAVMSRQVSTLLQAPVGHDLSLQERIRDGWPATLDEGVAALGLCDQARHRSKSRLSRVGTS